MEEGFVSDVRNLVVQLAHDADIFGARPGVHQRASFFQRFVDIQRLAHEVKLSGIGHGEGEQPFHDACQLLEFVVEHKQRFAIFLGGSRLGKHQFRFAMEDGEGSAKLVGGIGDELPQLANRGVHALEKVIKGFRQPAQFIVRRGDRQRAPESLAVRHAIGHQGSMLRERGDGREAPAYVKRRNQRSSQEAQQEKEQSDASEAVEHAIGAKGRNGDGQYDGFGSLLKRYQDDAHGLPGTKRRKTECWLRDGSAKPFQGDGGVYISRSLQHLTRWLQQLKELAGDVQTVYVL